MDDYCVNCKVFRNLSNKLDKVTLTKFDAHVIDEGYDYDPVTQRDDVAVYSYLNVYRCEYCKSIFFKEMEEDE